MYNYIYYRLYKFFLWVSKTDIPHINAILILSFYATFYFIILNILIEKTVGKEYFEVLKAPTIGFYIIAVGFNLWYFLKEKRYKKIKAKFDKTRNVGKYLLFILFMILPFLCLLLFTAQARGVL